MSLATIVVALMALRMTQQLRPMIEHQYRCGGEGQIRSTETYVGMHVFSFIVTHQVVMWPVTVIVFLLGMEVVRSFLFHHLAVAIVASIGGIIIVLQFLSVVVVGMFFTKGVDVLMPELYSIWHFVALILSMFAAPLAVVARWVLGLAFYSALFARLDISVYPAPFLRFDFAYSGFRSMVVAEAKVSHPIYLVFSSLLLLEQRLMSTGVDPGRAQNAGSKCEIEIDEFNRKDDRRTSAVIQNLTRVYLRRLAHRANSLELHEEPIAETLPMAAYVVCSTNCKKNESARQERQRRERIRNRWWLYYLLSSNPILKQYRKHNIYEDEDKICSSVIFLEEEEEEPILA